MVSFWFTFAKVLRRSLVPLARLPEEQARFLALPWIRRFKERTRCGDSPIHQAFQVWSYNPTKWNNCSWCTSAFAALSKASQRRFGGSAATTASWRLCVLFVVAACFMQLRYLSTMVVLKVQSCRRITWLMRCAHTPWGSRRFDVANHWQAACYCQKPVPKK